MRVAITGGTGFVGRHLARRLVSDGHEVVLLARGVDGRDVAVRSLEGARFVAADTSDVVSLAAAFQGSDAVAHLAGINRETGRQTYARVHVEGTARVVEAARRAGVRRVALLSFLNARPACGSPYHESKWAAEELVRGSGLDYTVLKAGMVYGLGDHMLDHLSHALFTFPVFPLVGRDIPVRPLAVDDLVDVLVATLVDGRLTGQTVGLYGPEEMPCSEAIRRVGVEIDRRARFVRLPVSLHVVAARVFEATMTIPLVARAQVRILAEGVYRQEPASCALPPDLVPSRTMSPGRIRAGLPDPGPFGLADLRRPSLPSSRA